MPSHHDRASARPLPLGLHICETCGEARGTTSSGAVSACFCSGLICNRCGERHRRPITDYYDWRDGAWVHVPYFALMAHTCRLALGEAPHGTGWTHLEPDPDVLAYQEAVTEYALSLMGPDTELDIVEEDRHLGTVKPGRAN